MAWQDAVFELYLSKEKLEPSRREYAELGPQWIHREFCLRRRAFSAPPSHQTTPDFAPHPQEHSRYWNEGFFLVILPEIKILISSDPDS